MQRSFVAIGCSRESGSTFPPRAAILISTLDTLVNRANYASSKPRASGTPRRLLDPVSKNLRYAARFASPAGFKVDSALHRGIRCQ